VTFAEKLVDARKKAGLTQAELAKAIGISRKAVQDYETAGAYPRTRDKYRIIAETLGVEVNYLLTDDEEFVVEAKKRGGSHGKRQAMELVGQLGAMFAGGEMDDDDRETVMMALQEAYWKAKSHNKKYTPKKYQKGDK
jgi:transcriptional regulator with XRE-family HTH domain